MKSNRARPVSEQAAEWFVELDEPPHSETTRRRFFDWLKQSPQHIEEFLAIAELERAVAARSSPVAGLVDEARANAGSVAFIGEQLPVRTPARNPAGRSGHRRWRRIALASAAAVVAVVAVLVALVARAPVDDAPTIVHRTELGEQRSIALGDGSIVTLNTLSEAVVRFDDDTRRVALAAGEAMFDVAEDPERPFIVEAGNLSVTVVGTRFSMYRKGTSTQLAVVEGIVTATAGRQSGNRIELYGGQVAVFDGEGGIRRDENFDVERAVAWTERRLIFDKARLADVVREFNRYNRIRLQVEDTELADRRITSVFLAHDVSALLAFLKLQPDVRVEYGADTIRIGATTVAR